MQERHKDYERYFAESEESCQKYYLPYIKQYTDLAFDAHLKVLEVGCGIGGNVAPFARIGCQVSGVDIDPLSIDWAQKIFAQQQLEAKITCADIHEYGDDERYHLIMLHDAIEHIPAKKKLMLRLRDLLTDEGVLYIAFPAWRMPFGGHQQVARTKLVSRCPFIHLLPRSVFVWLLRRLGEPEAVIKDFLSIKSTRMTIQAFQKLCADTDFEIIDRRLYLINPHYEKKFGLKPRVLWNIVAKLPYVRDYFSTSCHYLMRKRR